MIFAPQHSLSLLPPPIIACSLSKPISSPATRSICVIAAASVAGRAGATCASAAAVLATAPPAPRCAVASYGVVTTSVPLLATAAPVRPALLQRALHASVAPLLFPWWPVEKRSSSAHLGATCTALHSACCAPHPCCPLYLLSLPPLFSIALLDPSTSLPSLLHASPVPSPVERRSSSAHLGPLWSGEAAAPTQMPHALLHTPGPWLPSLLICSLAPFPSPLHASQVPCGAEKQQRPPRCHMRCPVPPTCHHGDSCRVSSQVFFSSSLEAYNAANLPPHQVARPHPPASQPACLSSELSRKKKKGKKKVKEEDDSIRCIERE
ncbi:unnamed protein product, partial [Closterium sp. NIES-65]